MPKSLRRLVVALLLILTLPMAGCFDYEVELTLYESGKGELDLKLSLPSHMAAKGQQDRLANIVLPVPERTSQLMGGRTVLHEMCEFDLLSELAAFRNKFDLLVLEKGLIVVSSSQYRLTATLSSLEGDLPDRRVRPGQELEIRKGKGTAKSGAAARAQRLLARTLRGHYVTLTLNLPGQVIKTFPVMAGQESIQPEVSAKGSTIRWRVPLWVLASQNVRHSLTFRVEFKGDMDLRSRRTMQLTSRYPTGTDLALAKQIEEQAASGKSDDAQ
jgi:hypothetical protein